MKDQDDLMLFEMVWDLTCDVWAFGGSGSAKRRRQRHVTNLVGRKKKVLEENKTR